MSKKSKLQLTVASPCPASWDDMEGDDCVRFYQREDGTVLTSDCPVGANREAPIVGGIDRMGP